MLEVFFADVGQGTCQIILLGQQSAIVIDAGARTGRVVLPALANFGVRRIELLAVSHHHADHSGGAVSLLDNFVGRVKKVCFLDDAARRNSPFWRKVVEQMDEGSLTTEQAVRIEALEKPQILFQKDHVELQAIAPNCYENMTANDAGDTNRTSAVLLLKAASRQILFTGDSPITLWKSIRGRLRRPIRCDIVTAPHHAGKGWDKEADTELDWLYHDAVRASLAVVSVGTSNTYGHPRVETFAALRRAGVRTICTQMTKKCRIDLEAHRQESLPIVFPSDSCNRPDFTSSGRSRRIACMGSILATMTPEGTVISRLPEHQRMIDGFAGRADATPLCRPIDNA